MPFNNFILKQKETGLILNVRGVDEDPWFMVENNDITSKTSIKRGNSIILYGGHKSEEERTIIGVTYVPNFWRPYWRILAPKIIKTPELNAKYLQLAALGGSGNYIELSPGTTIIGGRNTEFYNNLALILSAEHIGGRTERFEDWAYLVTPLTSLVFGGTGTNWITLGDIISPTEGPGRTITMDNSSLHECQAIDALIKSAEKELLHYISPFFTTIRLRRPKQFESTVQSVFSYLGFSVVPIGTWKKGTVRVDFIAISKTLLDKEIRLVVQCKTSQKKVSAKPLRELAGVLTKYKDQQGVLATSSVFTHPTQEEKESTFWQISHADREGLYKRIIDIIGTSVTDSTSWPN